MKVRIISIIAISLLLSTLLLNTSIAATQSDVNKLNQQKNEAQNQLNNIKEEKKTAMEEVAVLNEQLEGLQSEIDKIQAELDALNNSISQKQAEIEQKEAEILEKQELLKKRLVSLYKSGGTSYLDVLLGSSNYLDMISSYDAVKDIANADTELINQISDEKTAIEKDKAELEESKAQVDTVMAQKEAKNTELKEKQAQKNAKVNELTADEKAKQAEIDKYNKAIVQAEAEIRAQVEANRNRGTTAATSSNYISNTSGSLGWPLPLQYARYSYITSYFGRRAQPTAGASTNHGAIDIGVSYQPVYAAESGVVVMAQYVSGYGNFIMIWHKSKGELYTCYGHLSQYCVSAGNTVSRGQQIAVSGNTGISTGPHLHFEVRSGGSAKGNRVDPLGYLSLS